MGNSIGDRHGGLVFGSGIGGTITKGWQRISQKIKYRYSDGNTYTDYDTKAEALKAKRAQNGGTVTRIDPTRIGKRKLDADDIATILSALRFWQVWMDKNGGVAPIADHFSDGAEPLSDENIDELCE